MRTFISLALLAVSACGSTGQERVSYPLFTTGGARQFTTMSGYTVTVDVAEVALGPIYFCSTRAASSQLCPSATNELAAVIAVDALAEEPSELGVIHGAAGTLRSVAYDFGITWFPRQQTPTAAPEAPGGHSAHFEGHAEKAGAMFRFSAAVDLPPAFAGERAVQGQLVDADIESSRTRLDVGIDPAAWLSGVDFDELALLEGNPKVIAFDSRAYNSIALKMTVGAPPSFSWSQY